MRTLFFLFVVGAAAFGAYNYSHGRDVFSLPGTSARALKDTVRDTVKGTMRDTVKSAAVDARATVREARDEVKQQAAAAALTAKIKAKLTLDDGVTAGDIDVDTEGGVVTLTGTVQSKDEQRRAVRIATETAGVTRVVNHLQVR